MVATAENSVPPATGDGASDTPAASRGRLGALQAGGRLAGLWSEAERAAWRPPARLKPSQWAPRHRWIKGGRSSRGGQWQNRRQPILAPLMDLCVRRAVRELWVEKCAQFGGSEALRNVLAFLAHTRPCGVLWVMPNKDDGKKQIKKYLRPIFDGEDVPVLADLKSERKSDNTLTNIRLNNGFDLQLAWGGSRSSMSAEPRRLVVLDEVDKFLPFTGVEANAVDLARQRTHTFGPSALLICNSTPTTPDGAIHRGREACPIQLRYYVKCPHEECGHEHTLDWDNLKFEKFKDHRDGEGRPAPPGLRAALIRARGAAWMVCPSCEGRIEEKHKQAMLEGGYWGTPDGAWKIFYDGHEEGEKPIGDAVGVQFSRLYDVACSWADVAAFFVGAKGNLSQQIDFYNGWLGEPYKDLQARIELNVIQAKCVANPETGFTPWRARLLPPWVARILMTVDTQKDHFYWVVRGWGAGRRSIRIDHGIAHSFEHLEALCDETYWHYPDDVMPPRGVYRLGIDTGGGMDGVSQAGATRTEQVIEWCNKAPLKRLALKGASRPLMDVILPPKKVGYTPPAGKRPTMVYYLHFVDGLKARDLMLDMVLARCPLVDLTTGEAVGEQDLWLLNDVNDEVYNRQMTNIQRVRERKGGRLVERYMEKTVGARHDYPDVEAYNVALALGPGAIHSLPTQSELLAAAKRMVEGPGRAPGGGYSSPDGREYLANHRR